MRGVLEAHFGIDLHHFPVFFLYQAVGHFQPLTNQPFLGRQVTHLLEIALEGGQATPRVMRQFLERELVHVVPVHEVENVHLPQGTEIEQDGHEAAIRVEQGQQAFFQLQAHHVVLRLHLGIEVRGHRGEKALNLSRRR